MTDAPLSQRVTARPASERPSRRSASTGAPSRLSVIAWGGLGFLIGAVFWHFIGFWGFVSDIVLRGHPEDARVIAQTGRDCTELALDRNGGVVKGLACPMHAPELPESGRAVRENSERLLLAKKPQTPRWTILVNQDIEATTEIGSR